MVRAGIFHDNPESAAKKVNEIYEDSMSWWLSSEVQEPKNRFCHRFARTSETWLSEWKEEILRVAGE
jgi:putative transferase (TIGR04331 family)